MYFLVLESAARAAFEVPICNRIPGSVGWSQIWKEARSLGVLGELPKAAEFRSFWEQHGIQV